MSNGNNVESKKCQMGHNVKWEKMSNGKKCLLEIMSQVINIWGMGHTSTALYFFKASKTGLH